MTLIHLSRILAALTVSWRSSAGSVALGAACCFFLGCNASRVGGTLDPAPGNLSATSSSLAFGTVPVGQGKTMTLHLSNIGDQTAPVQISRVKSTGAGFSVSAGMLPVTLAAGQSLSFNVVFKPLSHGQARGRVSIVSTAANPTLTVPLSGTGGRAAQLTLTPATLNFGNLAVGTSESKSLSLSAAYGSVTVSNASWSGAGFSISGVVFPVTIAAGSRVPFSVTFTPKTAGSASGTLFFSSNASNSPVNARLSGTGTQAAQHSVALNWNASTSPVRGYYVYRRTKSAGGYARLSVLESGLTYVDTAVARGQTYYYVVTALAADNEESGFSSEVQATIP